MSDDDLFVGTQAQIRDRIIARMMAEVLPAFDKALEHLGDMTRARRASRRLHRIRNDVRRLPLYQSWKASPRNPRLSRKSPVSLSNLGRRWSGKATDK